jgi:hypothetical protein
MSSTIKTCSLVIGCAVLSYAGCGVSEEPEDGQDVGARTACTVPGFISGAPAPVGFASLDGGTPYTLNIGAGPTTQQFVQANAGPK